MITRLDTKRFIGVFVLVALIMGLTTFASAGVAYEDNYYTSVQVISTSSQGFCSAVAGPTNANLTGASVSVYDSSGKRIGYNADAWEGLSCSTSAERSGIASAKGSSSVRIESSYYTGASTTAYT